MRRWATVAYMLTVVLMPTGCCQDQELEFKVMAWNIWHGGHDESLPSDGRLSVVNIIKESGADVVLMIETYGSAPFIADSIGFSYHLISENLCIFSRFPIIETFDYGESIPTFNFGGAKVLVHGSEEVIFYDTWLHYLPDTRIAPLSAPHDSILAWENAGTRDDEIDAILKSIGAHLAGSDSVPVIMGGDFNSHSHLDWVESTKHLYNHGGAVVGWTISKEMAEAGFTDTYRYVFGEPERHPGTTWMSGRNLAGEKGYHRQDRIDYIYSKGSRLQIVDSRTFQVPDGDTLLYEGKEYMYPSDHGFVITTFRLRD